MPMREYDEKVQSLSQFAETLLDRPTRYRSYGIHAPAYLSGLEVYKRSHGEKPHTSLLVGALTPSTVTEYTAVTDHIFPNANLHLLDIEGTTTLQACKANGVT